MQHLKSFIITLIEQSDRTYLDMPHAVLKSATTAAGSPRALSLWCGPERKIISVTRSSYITSKSTISLAL